MRVRSIKHQVDRTQENVPRREFTASKPGLEFSGRNVEVVAKRLLAPNNSHARCNARASSGRLLFILVVIFVPRVLTRDHARGNDLKTSQEYSQRR